LGYLLVGIGPEVLESVPHAQVSLLW
jgi:hypothetical protein